VYLDGIDTFHDAVYQHTPSDDEKHGGDGVDALYDDKQAGQQKEGGHNPIARSHMPNLAGKAEIHKLVDGTEDEDGSENVHQPIEKCAGHQRQYHTQDKASQSHDGEIGPQPGELVALGIVDHCVARPLLLAVVDGAGDDSREKKQNADEDGEPGGCLLAVSDEQCAHDDGDDGTEKGTL